MASLRVSRATKALRGRISLPGDKSLAHRWLMLAPVLEPASITGLTLDNVPASHDIESTLQAMRALGANIEHVGATATIMAQGLYGLRLPTVSLDCGNSGTTLRLLSGLLAGQRFGSRLIGDASLSKRSMRHVVEGLRARGAMISGTAGTEHEMYAPIHIAPQLPGEFLSGLEIQLPTASAQIKSAFLFSGLYAQAPTIISEPALSRDHTERILAAFGLPLERLGGHLVLDVDDVSPLRWPNQPPRVCLPGDPSSAAFVIAAATLVADSQVELQGVLHNPTRNGFISTLAQMGASIKHRPCGEQAFESVSNLFVRAASLRAGNIAGESIAHAIDELPLLAAVATQAHGATSIRDAHALRGKESDRIASTATVLRAFGADVVELEDGLLIHGPSKLCGTKIDPMGDHRIAMLAAILALVAEGQSEVLGAECIDISFPEFVATMQALGARIER